MSTKNFFFKVSFSLLSLSLMPTELLAQKLDAGIFYAVDDLNSGKTSFNPTAVQCLTEITLKEFEVSAEDLKYRQQCARALCGAPTIVQSVYVDKKNIESYLTPAFKYRIEVLKPKLKAATESIRQSKKNALKEAEGKLFKGDQFNFNPKSWENTDAFNEINLRTFEKYLKIKIDSNAPLGKKISYQIVDDGSMAQSQLPGLIEYKERLEKFKNTNPETLLKFNLLSKDETKQYIKNQIAQYEDIINKDPKKSTREKLRIDSGRMAIKRLKDSLNKPINDQKDFLIDSVSDIFEAEALINEIDPNFVAASYQKSCTTPNCMASYQAYFQSIKAKEIFNNYKAGLDDPKIMERSMSRCIANMVATETVQSSQEKADKLFAEVLPNVLQNVVGSFSDGTKKYYAGYFSKQLAISSKAINPGIKSGATPFERYDVILDSITKEPLTSEFDEATTLREIIRHSDGEIPNPLANSQFCNSDPIANAWDAYLSLDRAKAISKLQGGDEFELPKKDTLYVSPFTCNHTRAGKSIVAHELGHAINDGFLRKKSSSHSTQIFLKLRNCISNNHSLSQKLVDNEDLSFAGDYLKSEEDTADLLAFMAFKDERNLFTCSLLKQDDTNTKYLDLYLAEDTESSHSPAFYRLLMETINKGISLPPSCQVVVDKSKSLIGFQKCLE